MLFDVPLLGTMSYTILYSISKCVIHMYDIGCDIVFDIELCTSTYIVEYIGCDTHCIQVESGFLS